MKAVAMGADSRGWRPAVVRRWAVLIPLLLLASCVRVGRDFPDAGVSDRRIGETTKADVRELFGEPWRTGIEDGMPTWTYGRYEYRAFGDASTKDLVIRFDRAGVVTGYTFNRSNPDE